MTSDDQLKDFASQESSGPAPAASSAPASAPAGASSANADGYVAAVKSKVDDFVKATEAIGN